MPVLVSLFRLATLEAAILNKAMSLLVAVTALLCLAGTITPNHVVGHLDAVFYLLVVSLIGA